MLYQVCQKYVTALRRSQNLLEEKNADRPKQNKEFLHWKSRFCRENAKTDEI